MADTLNMRSAGAAWTSMHTAPKATAETIRESTVISFVRTADGTGKIPRFTRLQLRSGCTTTLRFCRPDTVPETSSRHGEHAPQCSERAIVAMGGKQRLCESRLDPPSAATAIASRKRRRHRSDTRILRFRDLRRSTVGELRGRKH